MTHEIAIIQFAPALGDVAATLERLDPLLRRADDAHVIVLPELCNSGYAHLNRDALLSASEPRSGGPFLNHLIAHSQRTGAHIVTGLAERYGDQVYNSAALVGPSGVELVYRKLHLFDGEKALFAPGDAEPEVADVNGLRLGMLICFDWTFPEVWRILALKGADLIAHPSNLVLPGRCQRAVPVHAMIQRVFVATANRTGDEGGLHFTGRSLAAAPDGTVLAEASPNDDAVLRFSLDVEKSRDKRVTPRNDLLADRRPEHYGTLAAPRTPGNRNSSTIA